ncbi:MarR family transcriptional regulator [uncultured Algimonas sp.]|uniref:MarR family winged helix-turn-helix transcriptional regulator n=1 Tax=uncultured Algimonas sp. TaxID=1547920 RepID=UPI002610C832|nr:MarR family transcriptional regulator [uncultured Algimonas sp.]
MTPSSTDRSDTDLDALEPLSLDASWIYKVAVLADRVARHTSQTASDVAGLNLSQWRVLAAIADETGRTASQVVALTPMDKGLVSRAVATLVEAGLVQREASDQDGRRAHLHLTPRGRQTYDRIIDRLRLSGGLGWNMLSASGTDRFLKTLDRLIGTYPRAKG